MEIDIMALAGILGTASTAVSGGVVYMFRKHSKELKAKMSKEDTYRTIEQNNKYICAHISALKEDLIDIKDDLKYLRNQWK